MINPIVTLNEVNSAVHPKRMLLPLVAFFIAWEGDIRLQLAQEIADGRATY